MKKNFTMFFAGAALIVFALSFMSCGAASADEFDFGSLKGIVFTYSSGAGGWYTDVEILPPQWRLCKPL